MPILHSRRRARPLRLRRIGPRSGLAKAGAVSLSIAPARCGRTEGRRGDGAAASAAL